MTRFRVWIVVGGLMTAVLLLTGLLFAQAAQPDWADKVDAWVWETAVSQGQSEFLVTLTEQADLSGAAARPAKLAKGQYVYEQLTAVAQRAQAPLIAELKRLGVEYQSFYVANMVWVKGDTAVIESVARRPDVAHLYANPAVQLRLPPQPAARQSANIASGVEASIALVNADDVWAAGYTGQGVVIGGQDTGYDWDHPALKNQYRGWDGQTADHNFNWHDAIHSGSSPCGFDALAPCDDQGHGTHTMGTMVGDDGGSNQIGMAPGAKWIGCRNMDQGWGTPATYAECYEWFIAPYPLGGDPLTDGDPAKAPDVINNSWACPPVEGCTDPDVLLTVVQNVRAAGIVTVHSAGNEGSGCGSVIYPAAIYDESFSVAATNNSDAIAGFSSRGPVTVDGSNRLKPDISAPGVSIRSSFPGTGYGPLSGTSMAGPHVAGLVALLLSVEPSLKGQVDGIETLVQDTAVPFTTTQSCGGDGPTDVPNHVFGYGRIDALTAFAAINNISHSLSVNKRASQPVINAGGLLTYTLTIRHFDPITSTKNVVLTDTLPIGTQFITATEPFIFSNNTIQWNFNGLSPSDSTSVNLVIRIPTTFTNTLVENSQYGVISDESLGDIGTPVTTLVNPYPIQYLYYFPLLFKE